MDNQTVKRMSECLAAEGQTTRVCFDRIGSPVLDFAIFGNITCQVPKESDCSSCIVETPGL